MTAVTAFADTALTGAVRALRRRRKWPHLVAIAAGLAGILYGCGPFVDRIFHQHDHTVSVAVGGVLYVGGCALAAWGVASGRSGRWRWLTFPALLLLSVAAILLLGLAAGAHGGDSGGGSGQQSSRSGGSDRRARRNGAQNGGQGEPRPGPVTLPQLLVEQTMVTSLLGPTEPPDAMLPKLRRGRTSTVWRSQRSTPPGSHQRTRLLVEARLSARAAARIRRGAQVVDGASAVRLDVGDGAILERRQSGNGQLSVVRAARGEWSVTVALRDPGPPRDPSRQLIAIAAGALDRLVTHDPGRA